MPEFERFDVPLRLGVVADTHRTDRDRRPLPDRMTEGLRDCDLILHLGDFNAAWVADALAELAPVRAVVGNNDEPELSKRLPDELFLQIGAHRIGVMHGHLGRGTARQNAYDRMHGMVDCIVYGHSHRPEAIERDGVLIVNPGSPTQRRFAPHHSYAILRIDDRIMPEIVTLD